MDDINEEQVGHMLHALGISYPGRAGKLLLPGVRHRPLPVAYRNYYQVSFCAEWQDLVDKDMAGEGSAIGQSFYYVTPKGIKYLKELGYLFREGKA